MFKALTELLWYLTCLKMYKRTRPNLSQRHPNRSTCAPRTDLQEHPTNQYYSLHVTEFSHINAYEFCLIESVTKNMRFHVRDKIFCIC